MLSRRLLNFFAFIKVKHLAEGDERMSFLISFTALLYLFICSACMWCSVQVNRTCFQVSTSLSVYIVQLLFGNLVFLKNSCLRVLPIY